MKGRILDSMVLKKYPDLRALSPAYVPNSSLVSDFLKDHFFINKMVKFIKKIGSWEMAHLLKNLLHKHKNLSLNL